MPTLLRNMLSRGVMGFCEEAEAPAATVTDGAESSTETASESAEATTLLGGEDSITQEQPTETEAKDGQEETTEKAESEEKTEAETKAPEKYEFTMPEGVELDEKALEKFEPLMREADLSQEQAQKLAEVYAEQRAVDVQEAQEAAVAQWEQQKSDWVNDLKSDSDFGGANFDRNVETAKLAMQQFGSDELKATLNETGLGNHPEIVKLFHKIGTAISEDSFSHGSDGSQPQGAQALYANSNMNP